MKYIWLLTTCILAGINTRVHATTQNGTTYLNPVLPGFHPDPSCIFLPEWDEIFLCVSSSFNAFPGLPLHASKDLQNWKLIGHVLNRREQLPELAETNRSTSGIWAPTIRQKDGQLWVLTTLVNDHLPQDDSSRWSNVIFRSADPFDPLSWSEAIPFSYEGYDPSPLWDEDGKAYIVAAHAWRVSPGIDLVEANLETGEVGGDWRRIWNGTGGTAPEGPHIYQKDGYYYLLAAEGGTGVEHMVTIARSRSLYGPYESNPANPILTNANTTNYFQTVGHADLVEDSRGKWWCFALATRSGPEYEYYPMGRETVMAPARWDADEWPVIHPINGEVVDGLVVPRQDIGGSGPWTGQDDAIDFDPGSSLPAHFTYWRYPIEGSYEVSPPDHPNSLGLRPSVLNLTALNGNYAGPSGQTFVSRRQQHTLFRFSVVLDFSPVLQEEEAGISAFLTQNHHLDLGVVLLPSDQGELVPHFRFRGISYEPVPEPYITPVPAEWSGKPLRLEISAANTTHFWFSAGPVDAHSELQTLMISSNHVLSWGFTGLLLGVYATTNGGDGDTAAFISEWRYKGIEQYRD